MAVGEVVWYSKIHVAPDGTAPDVVVELPAGSYLVIAKASFVQEATYAQDSSGSLQLVLDDGESQETLDFCTAQFGAVEYSQEPVLEYPHELDQPDFKIVGWTVHGLAGGVAVINALASVGESAKLRLVISAENAQVLKGGTVSVLEVSVPPR